MSHLSEDPPTSEQSDLICDICGVNQSSTGKKFTHPAQVSQHKKKRHRETVNQLPQTTDSLPSAKPLHKIKAIKRKRHVDLAPAGSQSHVKFCPCCGFNLAVVHAAMEFVNGDPLA